MVAKRPSKMLKVTGSGWKVLKVSGGHWKVVFLNTIPEGS
jgi:hypothetical protein